MNSKPVQFSDSVSYKDFIIKDFNCYIRTWMPMMNKVGMIPLK